MHDQRAQCRRYGVVEHTIRKQKENGIRAAMQNRKQIIKGYEYWKVLGRPGENTKYSWKNNVSVIKTDERNLCCQLMHLKSCQVREEKSKIRN